MSGKEDYLDNLLKTVNAEEPGKDSALGKLSDIQEKDKEIQEDKVLQEDDLVALLDSLDDDAKDTDKIVNSVDTASSVDTSADETDFPELAKLFEENEAQENGSAGLTEAGGLPEEDNDPQTEQSEADALASALDGLDFDAFDDLKDDSQEEAAKGDEATEIQEQPLPQQDGEEPDDQDMSKLLDSISDKEDLAEISELLKKTDSNEIDDDMLSLMESLSEGPEPSDDGGQESMDQSVPDFEQGETEKEESGHKGWWNRKKEKKEKKEKKPKKEKGEKKEKGPGIFQRLLLLLTEESEEDGVELNKEKDQLNLSDENIEILRDIDKEKPKKAKKPKKEKKPKQKKEPKPKKEKKPKPPKPKKEKKEKPPTKPERPLGRKRIMAAIFLGITVYFGIQLFVVYLPDNFQKQEAKKAYQEGDLHTVYELLSTKKLNKNEETIFEASTLYMEMERKIESYGNYKMMDGMELEALNALISGVEKYKHVVEEEAQRYGVSAQVKNAYLDILAALQNDYGITEEEAVRLSMITDKVAYTKELKRIVGQEIPSFDEKGNLK